MSSINNKIKSVESDKNASKKIKLFHKYIIDAVIKGEEGVDGVDQSQEEDEMN